MFQGIVAEANEKVVVLKDATGKLNRIATADIDLENPGKSLMPEGITRPLTRDELVDLAGFPTSASRANTARPRRSRCNVGKCSA